MIFNYMQINVSSAHSFAGGCFSLNAYLNLTVQIDDTLIHSGKNTDGDSRCAGIPVCEDRRGHFWDWTTEEKEICTSWYNGKKAKSVPNLTSEMSFSDNLWPDQKQVLPAFQECVFFGVQGITVRGCPAIINDGLDLGQRRVHSYLNDDLIIGGQRVILRKWTAAIEELKSHIKHPRALNHVFDHIVPVWDGKYKNQTTPPETAKVWEGLITVMYFGYMVHNIMQCFS